MEVSSSTYSGILYKPKCIKRILPRRKGVLLMAFIRMQKGCWRSSILQQKFIMSYLAEKQAQQQNSLRPFSCLYSSADQRGDEYQRCDQGRLHQPVTAPVLLPSLSSVSAQPWQEEENLNYKRGINNQALFCDHLCVLHQVERCSELTKSPLALSTRERPYSGVCLHLQDEI